MGVILVILVVAVICILAAVVTSLFDWEGTTIGFASVGALLITIDILCAINIAYQNVHAKGFVEACKQRYNSLVYQLENNLYDNDNDLGKKELYDQIQYWNEDLAKGKALQNDFWLGAFYPDVYDQFNFIELK